MKLADDNDLLQVKLQAALEIMNEHQDVCLGTHHSHLSHSPLA